MPFPLPSRPSSVLPGPLAVIALALALAMAGCGHVTPLGPATAATLPPPRPLGSPIIMQVMLGTPGTPAAGCPAGYVALSGPGAAQDNGWCYRTLGAPVTFTSAGVATGRLKNSAGQSDASTGAEAALMFNLPAADRAALTAITTKAYEAKGYVDISVADQSWAIPKAEAPLTGGQFAISLPSRDLALQLQRLLDPPG
jgi:hypothetical protein